MGTRFQFGVIERVLQIDNSNNYTTKKWLKWKKKSVMCIYPNFVNAKNICSLTNFNIIFQFSESNALSHCQDPGLATPTLTS